MECFGTMFVTIFLMIDAVGNSATFYEVMSGVPSERYWWVLLRELLIALIFMLIFSLLGEWLLHYLEVSEITVRLTAGLILFIFASAVLFASPRNIRLQVKAGEEPFIVPLAVPMMASPALLATIMLYSEIEENIFCQYMAIVFAWFFSALVLLSNKFLVRIFGKNGLIALERLLALILVMLAVQRVMEGIELFETTYILKK
jgi:multiple antibiotic resistance protein